MRFNLVRVAALFALVLQPFFAEAQKLPGRGPWRGKEAPDFRLPMLSTGTTSSWKRIEAPDSLSLAALRGKVVVLTFWSPSCAPCVEENPTFSRLAAEMADSVQFVALTVDQEARSAMAYVQRTQALRFPIVFIHGSSTQKDYAIFGVPVTLVIDRDGIVVERMTGGPVAEGRLRSLIRKASARAPAHRSAS